MHFYQNSQQFNEQNSGCEFNESVVIEPLKLNTQNTAPSILNKRNKNSSNQNNFGEYDQYKLTNCFTGDFSRIESKIDSQRRSGEIIQILRIDPDSLTVQLNQQFLDLMKKYVNYDTSFVCVMGDRNCGKSFFSDKILNLAEVKGNQFYQKHLPGIYTWSSPFVKDNLCIFLTQISGGTIYSPTYKILTAITLILGSSIVFIDPKDSQRNESMIKMQQVIEKSLKAFDFSQDYERRQKEGDFMELFPHFLYNLYRNEGSQHIVQTHCSSYFKQIHHVHLPDARASKYKGKDTDLPCFSFLAKECINPNYIKQVSQIFKTVYKDIEQKKYNGLAINGSIVCKIINYITVQINAKKKIKVHRMYDQILKQLYVSAYNYCVMSYHQELQEYFQNQQPKNSEEMFNFFEKANKNTIQKYNQFNLHPHLHEEFQKKLEAHIDMKESLLRAINKQKTQDKLREHLNTNKQANKGPMELIRNWRPELDDGRDVVIKEQIVNMFKSVMSGNGADFMVMKKIQDLQQQKNKKIQILQEYQLQNKGKLNQHNSKLSVEKKKQDSLNSDIKKIKQEIQLIKRRQNSKKQGKGLDELISQRQKLSDKQKQVKKMYTNLKAQNVEAVMSQLQNQKKTQIQQIIKQQHEIQKELQSIKSQKTQNPKNSTAKNTQSKMKGSKQDGGTKKPTSNKKK